MRCYGYFFRGRGGGHSLGLRLNPLRCKASAAGRAARDAVAPQTVRPLNPKPEDPVWDSGFTV